MVSVSSLILLRGFILFSVWRKHMLIRLLRLEYMVLGLLILLHGSLFNYAFIFCLIYLTFTACEGALGLSILVRISRTHGRDYFRSFHMH